MAETEADRLRVVCVAGARPNYMKIKPVMDALEARGAETVLVHTGQHYDEAMNDVFFPTWASGRRTSSWARARAPRPSRPPGS